MFRKKLLAAIALTSMVFGVASAQDDSFTLTIMHTNDQHSHHQPNANGDGGVARLATVLQQIKAESENFLLVDAGDRFTGTLFHQQYRGQDQVQIMNTLGYDVMTLGNHEFDDGDDVLASFISGLDFPVVSANISVAEDGPLAGLFTHWTVLDVNGENIGFVGLTTYEADILSSPGEGTTFSQDYATLVNAATAEMADQGVNKIVLITHIGYTFDIALAPELIGVDIIVGGHSHTLLSDAYTAGEAPYPYEATSATGEPIYIAQAGGGSSVYVGVMDVTFDAAGVITKFSGDTIMLSRFITPDPVVEAIVDALNEPLDELRNTVIGQSSVFLVGDRSVCRAQECNLGDLLADAMRADTNARIAIINGGGLRSSIPDAQTPADTLTLAQPHDVTLGEVLTVLPFGNLIATFDLTGTDVMAAIESGLSTLGTDLGTGRFPQVSGLRYTFDVTQPAGSRVLSLEVEVEDGTFAPIDADEVYSVVSNDFMRGGGDGYSVFAENAINPYDFGRPLDQILADYIIAASQREGTISSELDGRITAVGAE